MKVLHLLKTSVGAGWALRQIRELVRLGVEVHVALPDGGPMVGKYTAVGATEHMLQTDFPIRSPWRFPSVVAKMSALVRSVQPDIIHSHFVGTTLTMRLALGRHHDIPRVFQVPGPLHLENTFFRNAEIATAGSRDYWIGSCEWTCQRYQKSGIIADRIFLSYYGGDLDLLQPGPRGYLREKLGLSESTKIIGMVAFMYAPKRYLGQIRGLKGHEDLIDAFSLCLQNNPDLRCVFLGGSWGDAASYEHKVKVYAKKKCGDNAIFLGTRSDVPLIYPDFDVAIHPSYSENVGGAGESLLMGVPTIATNIGGFPDVVINGETGWLVPPHSPDVLARTITMALSDPVEARIRAHRGQKLVRDMFNIKNTAKEVSVIYQKILGHEGA